MRNVDLNEPVLDILGKEVSVGTTIVAAFESYHSKFLRIGVVEKIALQGEYYKKKVLKVRWRDDPATWPAVENMQGKVTSIDADPVRLLVLNV